jgi:hypothetical protein
MPAANPFVNMIEVGGGATAGPVSAQASSSLGFSEPGAHHVSSALLLGALAVLVLLWKSKFRFSTTVG